MTVKVRDHHDACFLLNAVREHGERQTAAFQAAYVQALDEGQTYLASQYLRQREATEQTWYRLERRLNAIRLRYEQSMHD